MTGRVFNMDMERARRRPFASPPSSRDGLARVFVMEPEAVAPLEPPSSTKPGLLRRGAFALLTCGFMVWMALTEERR